MAHLRIKEYYEENKEFPLILMALQFFMLVQ
jgi:hypothetical protein